MQDLRAQASLLASKGRFGDTALIHVHPAELAGIASLVPGGQLTINPETGLPEAFFFLPFLASLFGAAAPAAAAATAAAPAMTAGMAAGAGAAGAAGAAGTGSLLGSLTSGISSLFGGGAGVDALTTGSTAAAAAPAAATGGAALAADAVPLAANPAITAPVTMNAIAPASATGVLQPSSIAAGGLKPVLTTPLTSGTPAAAAGGATGPAINAVTPAATGGVTAASSPEGGGLAGLFSMKNVMPMYLASQLLSPLFNKSSSGDGKSEEQKQKEAKEFTGKMQLPVGARTASYPAQISPVGVEHNYFPNFRWMNNGGIVSLANGGLVPGYQGGGQVDPQMQPPQDMQFPMQGGGGISALDSGAPADIPSSPYPTSQIGEEPTPEGPAQEANEPSTADDHQLIMSAVQAIRGQLPKPMADQALMSFVKEFGEPALQDLVVRVQQTSQAQGGAQGDGQSDSVPAMINGSQPAKLSEGEYVVPSDVVSGLGNGSTDAGARHLDNMVAGTRQARTGAPQQPPRLNAGGLVPGYKKGGRVRLPTPADDAYRGRARRRGDTTIFLDAPGGPVSITPFNNLSPRYDPNAEYAPIRPPAEPDVQYAPIRPLPRQEPDVQYAPIRPLPRSQPDVQYAPINPGYAGGGMVHTTEIPDWRDLGYKSQKAFERDRDASRKNYQEYQKALAGEENNYQPLKATPYTDWEHQQNVAAYTRATGGVGSLPGTAPVPTANPNAAVEPSRQYYMAPPSPPPRGDPTADMNYYPTHGSNWSWGRFLNPFSEPPTYYADGGIVGLDGGQ